MEYYTVCAFSEFRAKRKRIKKENDKKETSQLFAFSKSRGCAYQGVATWWACYALNCDAFPLWPARSDLWPWIRLSKTEVYTLFFS